MADSIRFTDECSGLTESLKQLWSTVFGDSNEYISLFFEKRLLPGQCVAALDGDRAAAMAFLLPFTLKTPTDSYPGKYIYAVATHPQYRRMGLSTRLLEFAHAKAQNEGAALSALVPAEEWLFGYYSKRGFETSFYKREMVVCPEKPAGGVRLERVSLEDMISLRRSAFSGCSAFVDWDERSLLHQESENCFLGGETLHFSYPGEGYALCLPTSDGVFIREWAAERLYPQVIAAIAQRYRCGKVKIRLAADKSEDGAVPFAMTKWYTSERKAPKGAPAFISLVLD